MNHEWKVGELAVCITVVNYPHIFRLGGVYSVCQITGPSPNIDTGIVSMSLNFHGVPRSPRTGWWSGYCFRPLDESDYKRIAEKHQNPMEVRSGASFELEIRAIKWMGGMK